MRTLTVNPLRRPDLRPSPRVLGRTVVQTDAISPFARRVVAVADSASAVLLGQFGGPVTLRVDDHGRRTCDAAVGASELLVSALGGLTLSDGEQAPVRTPLTFGAAGISRTTGTYWLVDPLDGLDAFAAGDPMFTLSIALIENGVPTLGVVAAPVLGELWVGAPERAAWHRSRSTDAGPGRWRRISRERPTDGQVRPLRVVTSPHDDAEQIAALLATWPDAEHKVEGSALKLCRLASGEVDVFPRLTPTLPWCTAAGDAIVRACGGILLTQQGTPLDYTGYRHIAQPPFLALAHAGLRASLHDGFGSVSGDG